MESDNSNENHPPAQDEEVVDFLGMGGDPASSDVNPSPSAAVNTPSLLDLMDGNDQQQQQASISGGKLPTPPNGHADPAQAAAAAAKSPEAPGPLIDLLGDGSSAAAANEATPDKKLATEESSPTENTTRSSGTSSPSPDVPVETNEPASTNGGTAPMTAIAVDSSTATTTSGESVTPPAPAAAVMGDALSMNTDTAGTTTPGVASDDPDDAMQSAVDQQGESAVAASTEPRANSDMVNGGATPPNIAKEDSSSFAADSNNQTPVQEPELVGDTANGGGGETSPPVAEEALQNNDKNANQAVTTDRQRIELLERKLQESQSLVESLQKQQEETQADDSLLMELQSNLQQQMSLKAEAENKARLAENTIKELEATNQAFCAEIQQFQEIHDNLQQQMNAKAEAENNARLALERVQQLENEQKQQTEEMSKFADLETNLQRQMSDKAEAENSHRLARERVERLEAKEKKQSEEIVDLQKQICQAREEMDSQQQELVKIREERDEQRRKEMALTSRLNAAKMKESVKGNLAEQYEDDINAIERELEDTRKELVAMKAEKQRLESELEEVKQSSSERISQAEHSLTEERRLNEERKRKMKSFVENKAGELRQATADNEALQVEVNQTTRSLAELNNRWKQLHAQYVQSQTRNRELQRDMNRIKKDSENLHKVGDSLEMKLSRSATATEEHKNKRIAAKHELMTVLRTLEAEREVTAKLRDTIKFTFTPKALSQQRLLQESMEEFEAQLQKLSLRLGRPLPPSTVEPPIVDASENSEQSVEENGSTEQGKASRPDADINRLISKLERETQAVSQCIMSMTGNVERLHLVLDASGERSCYSVIGEILRTGGAMSSPAAQVANSTDDAEDRSRGRRITSSRHRYGTVPSSALH